MNPVIFDSDETLFLTQGIGTLDCLYCYVTEERNGIYELEARARRDSRHFDAITEGNIIVARHSNKADLQPFQIYKVTRKLDGYVDIFAEHISYRLNKNVVMPFTAGTPDAAIQGIKANAVDDCPFQFMTDMEGNGSFSVKAPVTIKAALLGADGSVSSVFKGGEFEFDKFTVRFLENRGEDRGVTLRYGKNITELIKDTDISDIYTAIVPYWTGVDENNNDVIVTLDEGAIASDYVANFPTARTVPVDMTDKFEEAPTQEALRAAGRDYVSNNVRRQLMTTVKTSFIDLSITDEYKDKAEMETVNLCDQVTVIYEALGISDKQQVVKVVYDVLLERNKSVELGDLKKTLASVLKPRSDSSIRSMIRAEIQKIKTDISVDSFYPVGSIYLTVNSENPGNIFGGTWQMIETGRYLRSVTAGGAGQTGGSTQHKHEYKWITDKNLVFHFPYSGSTMSVPAVTFSEPSIVKSRETSRTLGRIELGFNASQASFSGDHLAETETEYTAETETADTTPPYYTVYMWRRTA